MAIALKSIGIKISYAFETVAGIRPTSNYTWIKGMKEIPDFNPEPDTLETTTFDDLVNKAYTQGLRDLGGNLSFTANFTQELFDLWNDDTTGVYAQSKQKQDAGLGMWLCIDIPGLDQSCYVPVETSKIGLPGASVNEVLECNVYFTPVGDFVWDADPTYNP